MNQEAQVLVVEKHRWC